jgi:hypothetical protein
MTISWNRLERRLEGFLAGLETISFDRWEHKLDGFLEGIEGWTDRIADLDFLERTPNARTKLHLRLSTPVQDDFRLPEEFITTLETLGVDVNAIHAALQNHLPPGTLLEIRQRKTKLRIEIEGHHDL